MNEWKALQFAFKRTSRTEDLFSIIDRYENANAAYEGENDGTFKRHIWSSNNEPEHREIFKSQPVPMNRRHSVSIFIQEGGYIDEINVDGLEDDDILDLFYLPRRLRVLVSTGGILTGFDLSKLRPGLERLDLRANQISEMTVQFAPPSLQWMKLDGNPVKDKGIMLHLPLRQNMVIGVPTIGCLHLNGGQEHPTDKKGNWKVNWDDGTQIMVEAADKAVKFDFYSK